MSEEVLEFLAKTQNAINNLIEFNEKYGDN